MNLSIQPQGLHYKAPNRTEERNHFRAITTCSKKPHLYAGIKYDKIPTKPVAVGELGLVGGQQVLSAGAGDWTSDGTPVQLKAGQSTPLRVDLFYSTTTPVTASIAKTP